MTAPTHHQPLFHDWRGSAYDIGVQHGRTLARQIVAECQPALDAAVASSGRTIESFLAAYAQRYQPLFQEHAPRAIDEIRGIAQGSGLGFPYAFFAATRDGANLTLPPQEACTAFYCAGNTTTDGHVLLGQTKDTGAPLERYHIMRRTYDDGLAVLTLNYAGWIANIGLNSHGVACTGNSLYAQPAQVPTVPFSLMRCLIAEARSAEDFRGRMDELVVENGCFIVADATGRAFCFESVAGRRDCRDISDQAFGHANTILCPALKPYQDSKCETPSSPYRQKNIQKSLDTAAGRLNADVAKSILSDHTDAPMSVCLHPTERDAIFTTAAMIADCTAGAVEIAIGRPCETPFHRYDVRPR